MFIDRKALVPGVSLSVAQLRENCMGCEDCVGACIELIQMQILPEILAERREERL